MVRGLNDTMVDRHVSRRFTALLLILVFFLFSLNAYACLVPVFGPESMTGSGMNCSLPHEQSAKDFCDGFKHLLHQWESDSSSVQALEFCTVTTAPGNLSHGLFPEKNAIEARAQPPPVLSVPLYTLHRVFLI